MRRLVTLILSAVVCIPALALENLHILLTNDDGYQSVGIEEMHVALVKAGHRVTRVAPATQQSGTSSGVTHTGVAVTKKAHSIYAVSGRPGDAVRIGLGYILKDDLPDLVISGINFGQNIGLDVSVSGTVGAAITALQLGVPAIAISAEVIPAEYPQGVPSTLQAMPNAAGHVVGLLSVMKVLRKDGVLNINYPARLPKDISGVVDAPLASFSLTGNKYKQQPDGTLVVVPNLEPKVDSGSDFVRLSEGFITHTLLDANMAVKCLSPL